MTVADIVGWVDKRQLHDKMVAIYWWNQQEEQQVVHCGFELCLVEQMAYGFELWMKYVLHSLQQDLLL